MKNKGNSGVSGVTLVELSVVIVIIAMVLGMVLKGQDMAQAARINSAITDLQRYKVAAQQFRTKYYYLPGDIPNPTVYMSIPTCHDVGTNDECHGDGDGLIRNITGGVFVTNESLHAWQHLSLTGMITGKYTGLRPTPLPSSSGVVMGHHDGTDNIPDSRLEFEGGVPGGYWFFYDNTGYTTVAANYIILARDNTSGIFQGDWLNGVISGKTAAMVDQKIDDGHARTGLVQAGPSANAPTNCITGGDYDTSTSIQGCTLWLNLE